MKSIIEGERALCFWLSQQTEVSLNHQDEKVRQEASICFVNDSSSKIIVY